MRGSLLRRVRRVHGLATIGLAGVVSAVLLLAALGCWVLASGANRSTSHHVLRNLARVAAESALEEARAVLRRADLEPGALATGGGLLGRYLTCPGEKGGSRAIEIEPHATRSWVRRMTGPVTVSAVRVTVTHLGEDRQLPLSVLIGLRVTARIGGLLTRGVTRTVRDDMEYRVERSPGWGAFGAPGARFSIRACLVSHTRSAGS